jgi:hypothetical protein
MENFEKEIIFLDDEWDLNTKNCWGEYTDFYCFFLGGL